MQKFKRSNPFDKSKTSILPPSITNLRGLTYGKSRLVGIIPFKEVVSVSDRKYNNLWLFKILEILRDEHGCNLKKFP
jgi:hypothetical protein